jgi:hypothetical protein
MRVRIVIAGIVISCFFMLFVGCARNYTSTVVGSGNIVTLKTSVSGFKGIQISENCELVVTKADNFSVLLYIDDNAQSYVETYVENGILYIGLEALNSYYLTKFKAIIACPELLSLSASGASACVVSGFTDSRTFSISASGASAVNSDCSSEQLFIDASGSSAIMITGSYNTCKINLSGASVSKVDKQVKTALLNISGASVMHISASDSIMGQITGASVLYCNSTCKNNSVQVKGASSVVMN